MRPLCLALLAATAVPSAEAQTEGRDARLEGQFIQALTAMEIGDDSTALGALDQVLAAAPDDAAVLTARSEVAARLGDTPDAVFYARRAAEADARPEVLRQLAASLRAAGETAAAADALAQARRAAPDDLDVLVDAADLAAAQGDAAAEADALRALTRIGDTVGARLRLSVLAERAGDRDEARAQARAAARLSPTDPAVRRRLADLSDAPTPPASVGSPGESAGPGARADVDALLAEVEADPRRVEIWAAALAALAASSDPRAGATADDALLLFPTVPAVLTGAAEAYAAAGRPADATDAAQRGLAALDLVGDALPGADALRARLDAVLSR